jgi:YggT family protein
MLNQIIVYLFDLVFGLLVGAALLRMYMNLVGVSLANPLGQFVLALTDWIVRPLRRITPVLGRLDWASLLAAVLLALLHVVLILLLFGSLVAGPVAIATYALVELLRTALQGLMFLLIAYAILSWINPGMPLYPLLGRMLAPLLGPIRRVVPLLGGIDLSPLVLIVLLQIGLMLVANL